MAEVSDLKLLVPRDRRCPSIVDLEVSKMDNRQSFIKAVLWFAGVSVTDFFFFFLITPICLHHCFIEWEVLFYWQ